MPHQFVSFLQSLIPYAIGAVFGIAGTFASGLSGMVFAELDRRAKHKRNVARNVLKVCNEASTGNYGIKPRDVEHVNSVMTDLDGIDKMMGVKMNELVSSWLMNTLQNNDFRTISENCARAQKNREILVAWALRITSGKK